MMSRPRCHRKKRLEGNITKADVTTDQINCNYRQVSHEQQDIKNNSKEKREEKLLDKYSITIEGRDKKVIKHRKRTIKKLQKVENR